MVKINAQLKTNLCNLVSATPQKRLTRFSKDFKFMQIYSLKMVFSLEQRKFLVLEFYRPNKSSLPDNVWVMPAAKKYICVYARKDITCSVFKVSCDHQQYCFHYPSKCHKNRINSFRVVNIAKWKCTRKSIVK